MTNTLKSAAIFCSSWQLSGILSVAAKALIHFIKRVQVCRGKRESVKERVSERVQIQEKHRV
jgi:hypothetical protein